MGPTGRLAWRRPAAHAPPAVAVEPLQASSVCGVMARQGRCVAEAGVRDAASRVASRHAEAWVCPPASFPWPPFGSDSLSSVPLPLPGVPFVRAPTPGGAAGRRPDVGRCASGRNAPAGSFATGPSDSRRYRRGCCRCPRGRVRAFTGPALYRGGTAGCDDDGDSLAPGRLVACHRKFSFGRPDTAASRSAPEIESFADLSAANGSAAQTRNDEPKPVGKT